MHNTKPLTTYSSVLLINLYLLITTILASVIVNMANGQLLITNIIDFLTTPRVIVAILLFICAIQLQIIRSIIKEIE